MSGVRILIHVARGGEGWEVTVTGPDLSRRGVMRRVEDGKGGHFPAPADGACPDGDPEHAGCLRGADEVARAYREVAVARDPSDAKVIARLGRYLFDCLLGQDIWQAIKQVAVDAGEGAGGVDVVELALAWDPADRDLHRLNWELLYDGKQFLAEGCGRADVAITRVVPGSEATLEELTGPPKVLFAIGAAATDPVIRPGAETLGLLRHVESQGRTLHYRLLENATPQRLAGAVGEYRPDVVHLICHGEVDGDESVLLLRPDEPDQSQPDPVDARKLLQLLRANGVLPKLVVLSACKSGGVPRLLGGDETAPLAAQLVQGGVPVVVGMAGEISDLACRLFTRSFGKALLGGTSLTKATAEARRASLAGGAPTSRSAEWAFPAVFMSERVDPERPLVAAGADETTRLVNGWIASYGLNENPVFCGRTEFLEAYWEMMRGGRAQVLAVFVRGEGVRLGRTRLLRELAKQALRDGHVPVLLGTDRTEDPPRTLPAFCKSLERALIQVRRRLDLPLHADGQLSLLRAHDPTRTPDARLDPYIRYLLELEGEVGAEAARVAVQTDLARLAADARERHPHVAAGPGRVVLLLDGLGGSTVELVEYLHDRLLGDHGLGTDAEPVPVVLALAWSGQNNAVRQVVESSKPWLAVGELRPFQDNGEDLLAYEQVMLHPFNRNAMPGVSDLRWFFNRGLEANDWTKSVETTRRVLQGRPAVFSEPTFYAFLAGAYLAAFIKEAQDDQVLATFRGGAERP